MRVYSAIHTPVLRFYLAKLLIYQRSLIQAPPPPALRSPHTRHFTSLNKCVHWMHMALRSTRPWVLTRRSPQKFSRAVCA